MNPKANPSKQQNKKTSPSINDATTGLPNVPIPNIGGTEGSKGAKANPQDSRKKFTTTVRMSNARPLFGIRETLLRNSRLAIRKCASRSGATILHDMFRMGRMKFRTTNTRSVATLAIRRFLGEKTLSQWAICGSCMDITSKFHCSPPDTSCKLSGNRPTTCDIGRPVNIFLDVKLRSDTSSSTAA